MVQVQIQTTTQSAEFIPPQPRQFCCFSLTNPNPTQDAIKERANSSRKGENRVLFQFQFY